MINNSVQIQELRDIFNKNIKKYYSTEWWRWRREQALIDCRGVCQVCGRRIKERYQVHHRNYNNIGCEQPEDLMVTHGYCHKQLHK